jgi:hypothetical protein
LIFYAGFIEKLFGILAMTAGAQRIEFDITWFHLAFPVGRRDHNYWAARAAPAK